MKVAILLYVLVHVFLLGLAIGEGFLLHRLFPSIDLGTGVLVGLIAVAATIHFVGRLADALNEEAALEGGDEEPTVVFVPPPRKAAPPPRPRHPRRP